jgi:hypothetical protein
MGTLYLKRLQGLCIIALTIGATTAVVLCLRRPIVVTVPSNVLTAQTTTSQAVPTPPNFLFQFLLVIVVLLPIFIAIAAFLRRIILPAGPDRGGLRTCFICEVRELRIRQCRLWIYCFAASLMTFLMFIWYFWAPSPEPTVLPSISDAISVFLRGVKQPKPVITYWQMWSWGIMSVLFASFGWLFLFIWSAEDLWAVITKPLAKLPGYVKKYLAYREKERVNERVQQVAPPASAPQTPTPGATVQPQPATTTEVIHLAPPHSWPARMWLEFGGAVAVANFVIDPLFHAILHEIVERWEMKKGKLVTA